MSKIKSEVKHVILVREDLEMSPGKLAVQIHHASIKSYQKAPGYIKKMFDEGCIKTIILGVPDAYELVNLDYKLDATNLSHFLVIDLGVTEFTDPELLKEGKAIPEITTLGIIGKSKDLNKFTAKYSLYKPDEEHLEKAFNVKKDTQDVMKTIDKRRAEKFGKTEKDSEKSSTF